jgi:hypothetical protein
MKLAWPPKNAPRWIKALAQFNLLPNTGKDRTESVQQGSILAMPENRGPTDRTSKPKKVKPDKVLSEPVVAETEQVQVKRKRG